MKGSFPLLKLFLFFVVLPLIVFVAAALLHFRASLPATSVEMQFIGRDGPLRILRDSHGVPTVKGASDHDVYFGMGYVHAQDRLWQLETQRRIAQGRLSEIFGQSALKQDVWMRTLGLYETAKSSYPKLSSKARESLDAYAEGVNAWLRTNPVLPPEFAILDIQPEPWTPVDSLAWIKIFALNLSGNFDREIAKYIALQSMPAEKVSTFFDTSVVKPLIAQTSLIELSAFSALGRLNQSIIADLKIGGQYVGSNAWVVSGKLTRGNGAILANDPHLGLQIPSVWYPVVQQGERLSAQGMSLVGLPLVVFGQNGKISWGGTAMMADVQDLYMEQINANDSSRYLVEDHWEKVGTRIEFIDVKPDFPAFLRNQNAAVRLEIRSTRHGPLISDAIPGLGATVALQWTALAEGDMTYESFFKMNYAENWPQFRDAFHEYVAPALNMLYADAEGNIGYIAVGHIPVRKTGDGSIPVRGWTDEGTWNGFVPFDEMPQIYNPEKGYIVSANNNMTPPGYRYFISNDWAPPGRARRIEQLLTEKISSSGKVSAADLMMEQSDVVSLPALKMLPLVIRMATDDSKQKEALRQLANWNGAMDTQSVAAAIFNSWMRHLKQKLFSDHISVNWGKRHDRNYLESMVEDTSLETLYSVLTDSRELWCTHKPNDVKNSCEYIMRESLRDALNELDKMQGATMDSWRWGKIHTAHFDHLPFSSVKGLSSVFERTEPSGGSPDTINVADFVYKESAGYSQTFGSSFRQVIQLNRNGYNHYYMNSTGQSGNVFSEHYSDMTYPFVNVKYFTMSDGH